MQRVTPAGVMGRVGAAADAIVGTPQALSIAGGAALVSVLDYRLIFGIMASGICASTVYLWAGRTLTMPAEPAQPVIAEVPEAAEP